MVKIIVCYKIVPDEHEIAVMQDRTLDVSKASLELSPYDCNAVEAAMRFAAETDGSVTVLTAGGERVENGKMKKGILSRGPSEMFAVKGDALDSTDSYNIAAVLKAAIERIGGAELVICGEGSADMYNQQLGNMLGAMMGLPTVNGVSAIRPSEGGVTLERAVEDGVEVLECALPAVLSMTSDICPVKIPSMKDILAAGKKPCTVIPLGELTEPAGDRVETVNILAPQDADRKRLVVTGDADEQVEAFYNNIRRAIL